MIRLAIAGQDEKGDFRDARTFAFVVVTLAIITVAACATPALRASRVSPLVVLRYE